MKKNAGSVWTFTPFALALLVLLMLSSEVVAQGGNGYFEDEDEGGVTFEVGGSCSALAFLSKAQISKLIDATFPEDRRVFCHPEEPLSCSDHNDDLKDLGRLSPGEDGFHCSLRVN